ncbi:hypothetical protein GGS21DRAFT_545164 [Xylaria nigripes]|nr:hypothetical protein GGS21DRAFT_545164 [Xylaria nigripes]
MAYMPNAMLRGLNAIHLQAAHVRQIQNIADLLFLTKSWSAWLLYHHVSKEGTMLPGFEAALGAPAGTPTLPRRQSLPAPYSTSNESLLTMTREKKCRGKGSYGGGDEAEGDEIISSLLHRVYAYASATHKSPHAYDEAMLKTHLSALAEKLVPHLTAQIGFLASMREMCLHPSSASSESETGGVSTLARNIDARSQQRDPEKEAAAAAAAARHAKELQDANARASNLTETYIAAEAQATASMDRFVIPPMMVRLRDVTLPPQFDVFVLSFRLHKGAWRFLPCDVWGRPRELPFLG